jgi:hypothetical protein
MSDDRTAREIAEGQELDRLKQGAELAAEMIRRRFAPRILEQESPRHD